MRFILIDKILEFEAGSFVKGIKNVTLSENYLQDHFPGLPVFPGTLLIEACAQLSGFLIEQSFNQADQTIRRAVLCGIQKAKFHKPIHAGDQILIHSELSSSLLDAVQVKVEAQVNHQMRAQADLTFALKSVDIPEIHEHRKKIYQIWTKDLTHQSTIL